MYEIFYYYDNETEIIGIPSHSSQFDKHELYLFRILGSATSVGAFGFLYGFIATSLLNPVQYDITKKKFLDSANP